MNTVQMLEYKMLFDLKFKQNIHVKCNKIINKMYQDQLM